MKDKVIILNTSRGALIDTEALINGIKSEKIGGEELYLKLKKNGILVRHFTAERIKEYNRITIGTFEEMKTLVETVRRILAEQADS